MSWSSDITGRSGDIKGLGGRRSGKPAAGGGNGAGWLPGVDEPPSPWAGDVWPVGGDSDWATNRGCCVGCVGAVGTVGASVDAEAWVIRAEGKLSVPAP